MTAINILKRFWVLLCLVSLAACQTRSLNDDSRTTSDLLFEADRTKAHDLFYKSDISQLTKCILKPFNPFDAAGSNENMPPDEIFGRMAQRLVENKAVPQLYPEEFMSIQFYTENGTSALNSAVKGNSACKMAVDPILRLTLSGLSRLPAEKKKVFSGQSLSAELETALSKVGGSYKWPIFLSTSADKFAATEFIAQGGTMLEIETSSGRDISDLSSFASEEEVLLKPNTDFLVKKVSQETVDFYRSQLTYKKIELQEVSQDRVDQPASIAYKLKKQNFHFSSAKSFISALTKALDDKKVDPRLFPKVKLELKSDILTAQHTDSDVIKCTVSKNICELSLTVMKVNQGFYLPVSRFGINDNFTEFVSLIFLNNKNRDDPHAARVFHKENNTVFRCDSLKNYSGGGNFCRFVEVLN